MIGSKEHLDFIIEYISALEEKIKLANKNHFFDEAQLFELFAQEICKIWYKQDFYNLNLIKYNYPCVDLVSEDKTLFVQVSTQKDVFGKIKDTLKAIDNSDLPELKYITSPIFFVLSNESEHNVKDLIGDAQIGKHPFTVDNNLISTSKIIRRASSELDFQKELFVFLKQDVEGLSTIDERLLNQFLYSKEGCLSNIDTCINSEYEIDRTNLINKIKADANRFCLVCGEAGSGKSALYKKLLENDSRVLFARAEQFEKCRSIDEIWNIPINKAFSYLNEKQITVYIDALEYIANSGESSKELLQILLLEIKKHPNISFISSCRSCDTNAFIKMIGVFNIKEYLVGNISDAELKGICDRYPQIKAMSLSGKYSELLRSPFYINEIVTKDIHLSEPSDVNEFRDYIWKECICQNKRAVEKGISTTEVVSAVEHIVFERSKRRASGIDEDEVDAKILMFLSSNNVVTKNERWVRLKYDIYEDICYERQLDKLFDSCKGNYSYFFNNVEQLGYGSYRRYQIWISNKLLSKQNRDKFLYELVFNNELSEKWRKNTIIGLVKSPFCESFFDEQGTNLIEKQVIGDFVDITNCFAFDMTGFFTDEIKSIYILNLKASGHGRDALINLVYNKALYSNNKLEKDRIIKLCKDYATSSEHNDLTDSAACSIICHYMDDYSIQEITDRELNNLIYPMLETLHFLPKTAQTWINTYWNKLKEYYIEGDIRESRIAEEILSWTLKHVKPTLVDTMIDELLNIAETIWTCETKRDKKQREIYGYRFNTDYLWGIYGSGDNYQQDYPKINTNPFLQLIIQRNLKKSLKWIISLMNKMVSVYSENCPDKITKVVLYDCENNRSNSYIGASEMWFVSREDHVVPTLLGDMVYWLKETIIQMLEVYKVDKELFNVKSELVKSTIWETSNNLIPFVVIEDIGFAFPHLLPAYASLLASNPTIIYWDIQWMAHNYNTPAQSILKKQILMTFGIPSLESRYPRRDSKFQSLQDYVARCQFEYGDTASERCIALIDYLYKTIDESDSSTLLQIQKMDMRNAEYSVSEDGIVTITPKLTEGPKRIVSENIPMFSAEGKIVDSLKEMMSDERIADPEVAINTIEYIKSLMSSRECKVEYEYYYVMALAVALNNSSLPKEKRSVLVCDWAERLENTITHQSTYVADISISKVLFNQYRCDLDGAARNMLKRLMLECLIDCSPDGQVSELRRIIVTYLLEDESAAKIMFNTIIKLSEDEWNHTSYNLKKLRRNRKRYCITASYRVPTPDDIIKAKGIKPFVSKREEILERFLFKEETMKTERINTNHLDYGYLFIAMNVGLHFDNAEFYSFCKKAMTLFIRSMNKEEVNSLMDTYYQRLRVKELFERELTNTNGNYHNAVNLLFDDVDYNAFVHDTNEMYVSIYEHIVSLYFDAHNNKNMRKLCRDCIEYTATKIDSIGIPFVKYKLERILIFCTEHMWSDWNKFETHYSYDDKMFLCQLWNNHYLGHENEIIRTIYQLKTGELLPEVLPVIAKVVNSLEKKGERPSEECMIILNTIVLRSLLDYSDRIKSDDKLHNAYETILSALISYNNESAAVILDEYRTH